MKISFQAVYGISTDVGLDSHILIFDNDNPQMIKTIKLKDTSGVSLLLFIIYFVANIIALVYAFLIYQPPLMIKYIIALLTTIIYLGLYWIYHNRKRKTLQL